VNYVEAVHFHNFDESAASAKCYHMSSFSENTAEELVEATATGPQFVAYNMRQLSRIYPGGTRQDSSNLKPLPFWNSGCQIGRINFF
jgi:hypothetical protein